MTHPTGGDDVVLLNTGTYLVVMKGDGSLCLRMYTQKPWYLSITYFWLASDKHGWPTAMPAGRPGFLEAAAYVEELGLLYVCEGSPKTSRRRSYLN